MENKRRSAEEFGKSPLGKFFLGGLPILGGVLTILVSLSVLPYVDLHPNRIAIFNDPHTWEVFAVGVMLTTFGLASIIPPNMKFLGSLNRWVLLISFIAVVLGVILKKFF
ncbi:MAG: hypothetical protein IPP66_12925 [Anaerolineales bacterium]|nr:hypothetical protein [Anaerolineales bacterium]